MEEGQMEPQKRALPVSATTKQKAETQTDDRDSRPESWSWVEGCVWTEAMLAVGGSG